MLNRKKAHLAVTTLFALAILPGAAMNLLQPPMVLETMAALDVPARLLTLVGLWKLAGIAALALPVPARIKEWAYAGFFFDLTGAAYLHATAGDLVGAPPSLLLLALLVVSYRLRFTTEASAATSVPLATAR